MKKQYLQPQYQKQLELLDKVAYDILFTDKEISTIIDNAKLNSYQKHLLKKLLLTYMVSDEYIQLVKHFNDKYYFQSTDIVEFATLLRTFIQKKGIKYDTKYAGKYIKLFKDIETELCETYPDIFEDKFTAYTFVKNNGFKKTITLLGKKSKPTLEEQKEKVQIENTLYNYIDNVFYDKLFIQEQETSQNDDIYKKQARIKTNFINQSILYATQKLNEVLQTKFTNTPKYKPCFTCPYKDYSYTLFDEIINNPERKDTIDVLFIGMNPYINEIKEKAPFIGKAGQKLRELIKNSNLNNFNIAFFNSIPCFIPNNGDPFDNVIRNCSPILLKSVIKALKPKVIVLLGKLAEKAFMYSFNLKYNHIKSFNWTTKYGLDFTDFIQVEHKAIVGSCYHPSYVANYSNNPETNNKMINYFNEIANSINNNFELINYKQEDKIDYTENKQKAKDNKKVTKFDPKKSKALKQVKEYTSKGYKPANAVRSETSKGQETVLLKLINEQTGDFVIIDMYDYPYYVYTLKNKSLKEYTPLKKFEDLNVHVYRLGDVASCGVNILKKYTNKDEYNNYSYEADLNVIDYAVVSASQYSNYEPLDPTKLKVLYYDIEVHTDDKLPDEKDPTLAIMSITAIDDTTIYFYLNNSYFDNYEEKDIKTIVKKSFKQLEKNIPSIKDHKHKIIIGDEKKILESFFKNVVKYDMLAAWNVFFDTNYLCARWNYITDYKPVYKKYKVLRSYSHGLYYIPVVTSYDLLEAYKSVIKGVESYALDFIAQRELNLGKIKYEEKTLVELIKNNPETFILYNMQDTALIYELDKRYALTEIARARSCAASSSLFAWQSTLAEVDTLLYKFAHKEGYAIRTKFQLMKPFEKLGGFVRDPLVTKETKQYVLCYDVGSMYPNIIRTFNISPDSLIGYIKTEQPMIKDDLFKHYKFIDEIMFDNESIDKEIEIVFDPYVNTQPIKMTIKELRELLKDKGYIITPRGTIFANQEEYIGLLPKICTYIAQTRDKYKKLAKTEKLPKWSILSTGIKILNNSIYGSMGNEYFRFFNTYLIESVTLTGQMIIKLSSLVVNNYMQEKTTSKGG